MNRRAPPLPRSWGESLFGAALARRLIIRDTSPRGRVLHGNHGYRIGTAESFQISRVSFPDAAPTATIDDQTVVEGASGTTAVVFTVRLSFPSASRTIAIDYWTEGTGSHAATAGRDYGATSGTLTFAPGTTSQTISVPVYGDAHVEDTETFAVYLANTWVILGDSQGIGTITTDDVFRDDPLAAQTTPISAVHVTELRTNVQGLRTAYGLGPWSWTDPTVTVVRVAHVTDLRNALAAVLVAAGLPAAAYTDPVLTPGATVIKRAHVQELRDAVKAVP